MIRIDLAAADIPYRDDGKDYDFHALRHQFITGLARAGVSLKSAQELARHSKPELTANTYTHLTIKDTAADVEKMAAIPTGQHPDQQRATGTDAFLSKHMAKQELQRGAISGYKRSKLEIIASAFEQEKSPRKQMFAGDFERVTNGTRTRNFRNHNPVL